MKKAIYAIRDRKLPKQISDRQPDRWKGNSFIPPGWQNLVCMLDDELAEIDPDYILHQVKSKYGTLCYYTDAESFSPGDNLDKAHAVIKKYADIANLACEVCGQEGKKYGDQRWITTRCKNHKE